MENARRETAEEPVLLSWDMTGWKQWMLGLSGPVLAVGAGVVLAAAVLPALVSGLVIFGMIIAWVRLVGKMVVYLRGTSGGIKLRLLLGGSKQMRWADIGALKSQWPLIRLNLRKESFLLIGLSTLMKHRLIAILRETSNARIIGFDSEAT